MATLPLSSHDHLNPTHQLRNSNEEQSHAALLKVAHTTQNAIKVGEISFSGWSAKAIYNFVINALLRLSVRELEAML
ncbi:hypothetical protein AAIM60_21815 [Pseudomonas lijiangensis]|uniref:hypothetical protein n=1 Tax=Pseudomonas syringae group TaxID=136849 RepID=UPI0018E65E1C|nr:hypothetical protein [Pseudomonas cichorii]MBI6854159.1 hypothetical protein [Pseudomonas cichorii]